MGNTGLMTRDLEGWSKDPAKKDGIQRSVHKEILWKYSLPALSGITGLLGVLGYLVLFIYYFYFRSFSVTYALNEIPLLAASIGDLWPCHIIQMNLYWWDHMHRHTQSHHHTTSHVLPHYTTKNSHKRQEECQLIQRGLLSRVVWFPDGFRKRLRDQEKASGLGECSQSEGLTWLATIASSEVGGPSSRIHPHSQDKGRKEKWGGGTKCHQAKIKKNKIRFIKNTCC